MLSWLISFLSIIGGREAPRHKHDWIVNIRLLDKHMCGGIQLNPTTVLTAAHCVSHFDENFIRDRGILLRLTAGVHDTRQSSIKEILRQKSIHIHPLYDRLTHMHDLAIVKVEPVGKFRKLPQVILDDGTYSKEGQRLTIAGWGQRSTIMPASSLLYEAYIPVADRELCRFKYKRRGIHLDKSAICVGSMAANSADASNGDSGGPLFHVISEKQVALVGITSWGIEIPGYPGVYTRISDVDISSYIELFMDG